MNKLNDIFFTAAATEGVTYENVLEDAQRYFTENHAATIASEGDTERAAQLLRELIAQYIVKRKYVIEGLSNEELAARLTAKVIPRSQRRSSAMPGKRPSMPLSSQNCWAKWFGIPKPM